MSTNAAAAKARLVGTGNILSGIPGLDGVEISYNQPTPIPREFVMGGDVQGPVKLSAFRGGGGRVQREEVLSLQLEVRVYETGERSTEQADARAVEIATEIMEFIAANPKLGDLPGLLKATVDNFELIGRLDDEGSSSVVTLTIGLHSFLS